MTTLDAELNYELALRQERDQLAYTLDALQRAVDDAHRGGATVMRLETIRSLLAARPQRRALGRSRR